MLEVALEKLAQAHANRLAEYETLALQLARSALAQIFGEESERRELVEATIAHNLRIAESSLVLRLRVSTEDFGTGYDFLRIAERFPGLEIKPDQTLAGGECIAQLQLGELDLGLAGQWQRLSELFDRLARETTAT